jgi:YD repeat-containing protein
MKYLTLMFVSVIIFCLKIKAQNGYNNLQYTYDQAGNRISRYLQVTLNKRRATDTSFQKEEIVVKNSTTNALETVSYSIYPNPTSAVVNIDFTGMPKDGELEIMLTDAYGKLVAKKLGIENHRIDLSSLISGVYFVSMVSNHQKRTYRIVKI